MCATSDGPIVFFKWNWFGDFKDRLLGHKAEVNCIQKVTEKMFFAGNDDGIISYCCVFPKKIHFLLGITVKRAKE